MAHHVKDKADFEQKLKEAGDCLVVIDFHAVWCGPCKQIAPKIEELANTFPDIMFLKVDVDECEELATEYDISVMPTFIFVKNKVKIEAFSGSNFEKLQEMVNRLK